MNNLDLDFDVTYISLFRENSNDDNSDTQYRRELLRFFKLETYDDTRIGIRTDKLYHEIKENEQFKELFTLILSEPLLAFISSGNDISSACLSMLCSFNYFHLLFKSLKELKSNGQINENTLGEFRNEILRNINGENECQ